jgi:hypothetical protein
VLPIRKQAGFNWHIQNIAREAETHRLTTGVCQGKAERVLMSLIWRAGRGSARVLVRTGNFWWLAVTGGVVFFFGLAGLSG